MLKYRKILRYIFKTIIGLLGLIIIYMLSSLFCSLITVNSNFREDKTSGIVLYIETNGVHTDLVLPLKNKYKDWSRQLKASYTIAKDTDVKWLAFGWGDREFYMNTPEWSDLKFSTAFKALFFLGNGAMHVTFYKNIYTDKECKKVSISMESYKRMVSYIESSFKKNKDGEYILIKNHSYGTNDCFFEANGMFSLFYTCNTWTNSGLKYSGLKACLWTPFDKGILWKYK